MLSSNVIADPACCAWRGRETPWLALAGSQKSRCSRSLMGPFCKSVTEDARAKLQRLNQKRSEGAPPKVEVPISLSASKLGVAPRSFLDRHGAPFANQRLHSLLIDAATHRLE